MNELEELRRELRALGHEVEKTVAGVRRKVQRALDELRKLTGPPDSAA